MTLSKWWLAHAGLAVVLAVPPLTGFTLTNATSAIAAEPESSPKAEANWSTLIDVETLQQRLENKNLLIIDVRSAKEYAAGHIPGAINLPGSEWRTPAAKAPGKTDAGQKIFRNADNSLDVARYEKLLGAAGITPEHEVVVYGNHAGKADGSVPAAILLKLGHRKVSFLDGVGLEQWQEAGLPVASEASTLKPATYVAKPAGKRLWSYQDVLANLNNDDVVIIDSRTPEEYAGKSLRDNKRGGHIPGARLLNSEDFLNPDHTTISLEEAKAKLGKLPKGKTVVIYCQSGTRCSHKELLLKDLGYENVVLYDASWQEWGNREDTPIETSEEAADGADQGKEKKVSDSPAEAKQK